MQTKRIATIVTTVVVLALLLATNSTIAGPPVLGCALEPLAKGTGLIWVLVLGR
jgi:hypothetical protein